MAVSAHIQMVEGDGNKNEHPPYPQPIIFHGLCEKKVISEK